MAEVRLVETSLRRGNQCLWDSLGIDTARALSIAPVMDRVGFEAIDFTTATHMGMAVRIKRECPWERIRLMAAATPNTPLQFTSTGLRFISGEAAGPEFMALAYRVLARNGIRRFCLADPVNDAEANVANARLVKGAGGEHVIAALLFTPSPVHDDAYYAAAARVLAASPDIDALCLQDPAGLLSQLRAASLIPAIRAAIGEAGVDKPLELQSHNTIGLAEHTYLDAPDLGVGVLQCASGAAADGLSNPPVERIVANLRSLGHRVAVDDDALAAVSNYFTRLAEAEGLPVGRPRGFDAAYLQHQMPGATVDAMRRHLAEGRLAHLEGAVFEELDRVRQELGWPVATTPFAQMVITQAVMNVTSGERYGVVPDEVIRYSLGRFGRLNVPIAARVMERIESLPRTRELRAEPAMTELAEMRRRFGPVDDEELLLRATMPGAVVEAMLAAGPAARHYDPSTKPVLELLYRVLARRDLAEIELDKPGFRLALRRGASRPNA